MIKKPDDNKLINDALSVATSVAYTKKEIAKLREELQSVVVEQGPAGPAGPRGFIGPKGEDGLSGTKGDKGEQGPRGRQGERGLQGEKGDRGDVGPQGLEGPQGLQGPVGDRGDTGAIGPQGPQGDKGERGEKGDKGDKGDPGKNGVDGRDGQVGPMGPAGPQGADGIRGERGPKGDKGDRGLQGERGPKGESGPQGVQGLPGKDGKDGDIAPVEQQFTKFTKKLTDDFSEYRTRLNALISKSLASDAWKATGSGEVNLRYLDDIDRSTIQNGYVLSYNSTTQKFEFVAQTGGGGTSNPIAIKDEGTTVTSNVTSINFVGSGVTVTDTGSNTVDVTITTSGFTPTDVTQVFAEIKNAESFSITKGQAVYLYAATGNRASVKLANNTGDPTSAKTLGLVYSSTITPGGTGIVITQGVVTGVDTQAYQEGDTLYLANTAGNLTATKPYAPQHLVYIGVVERANQGQGQIYVRPQNGYELHEIHDVNINHNVALANADILVYNSTLSIWENRQVSYLGLSSTDNAARTTANSAFNQANTATTLAQAAYDYANTITVPSLTGYAVNTTTNLIWSTSNTAWATANASYSKANNAYDVANSAWNTANNIVVPSLTGYAVNTTTNLIWTTANTAWSTANTAEALAQAAYNYANTIVSDTQVNPLARSTANGAFDKANNSYDVANTAWATANAGYTKANTSYDTTNAAYDNSNSAFTKANTAFNTANTAYGQANTTYEQAVYKQLQTITANTTILSTDSNKTFLVENNSNTITLTLPDAALVTPGFYFKLHLLGDEGNKVYVEVGNTSTNIVKTGGVYYTATLLSQLENTVIDSIDDQKFTSLFTTTSTVLQELIQNTYKYEFTRINNTTFLISK